MRFRTRNVRNLCGVGLLKKVASKLAKYNLDLVAIKAVRWDNGGSELAITQFSMEMGMLIII
jgi:hypothetical protein